jgi:hypothetical protein
MRNILLGMASPLSNYPAATVGMVANLIDLHGINAAIGKCVLAQMPIALEVAMHFQQYPELLEQYWENASTPRAVQMQRV